MMKLSQEFWEKIIVLLVTATVTGLLIPYILKRIDESKAIEQKRSEAEILRQAKLIEAQSKFLDDTTEILWAWRYLSMKVAFNGSEEREEQYSKSVIEYEQGIWDVLSKIRNQASKSRRLVSDDAYQNLVSLYRRIVELDSRLDKIVRGKLPLRERTGALEPIQKELYGDMTQRLDDTLDLLAKECHLKALPMNTAIRQ